MRYSKPHSSDSQSLIVNNKYTTWSAYLGVDKLLNAIWHNVFSMSVLASLLFLAVTIGSPPHFNILTKTAASSVAARNDDGNSGDKQTPRDVFSFETK